MMIRKGIITLLGTVSLLASLNANALLFTSDKTTDFNDYGTPIDISGSYNIGGAVYANRFIDTQGGITMTIDTSTPDLLDGKYLNNSGGIIAAAKANFFASPHGLFAGSGTGASGAGGGSNTEFTVSTSFTLSFSQDVILNWISFDNIQNRSGNVAPQFNIGGSSNFTAKDTIINGNQENHDINNVNTRVLIGISLSANVDYMVNVLPNTLTGTNPDSLAEFWGWDVTPVATPVPAAVWFLLSGLAALFGFNRKRR